MPASLPLGGEEGLPGGSPWSKVLEDWEERGEDVEFASPRLQIPSSDGMQRVRPAPAELRSTSRLESKSQSTVSTFKGTKIVPRLFQQRSIGGQDTAS
jgi:hypothetical protein